MPERSLAVQLQVWAAGGQLMIEGKHAEKSDEHGQIERHFVRKYTLPKECHADALVSRLSREGVLTVMAPKNENTLEAPRLVPILPAP